MGLIKNGSADIRALQKTFDKQYFTDSDGYLVERTRSMRSKSQNAAQTQHRGAPRTRRQAGSRSSAASGDGNDDGEPPRSHQPLQLLNQNDLADILSISKKTLQNTFSRTPHLLPKAIQIPGARGPRWTAQAVQLWIDARPAYTTKPAPGPTQRKVGRPRTAFAAGKGGAK